LQRHPDESRGAPDALHIFLLITRREFLTRVRSRLFLIGTVLLMGLLAGYIVLQAYVFNRSTTTVTIGFVGASQSLAQPLKAAISSPDLKVDTQTVSDVQTGEDMVRSGDLDALVSGDPSAPHVAVKDSLDPTTAATLTGLVQLDALNRAVTAGGLNASAIDAKVESANFQLDILDPNAGRRTANAVIGIFVAALLYVAIQIYGQLVAGGVVEEKANRIVEILLSTVRPRQLLFGKVVGIGLVGFLQLFLLGVVAIIAVMKTHVIAVPSVGVTAVAAGLLWFVLGFIFFALIYAAGGSLVSRAEDAGAVTVPITLLIVGAYLSYFWVVSNPDSPIAAGLSMIPGFAPVLMPARMATGDAQAWQVVVAVVLTIGGIVALNALAARIYANSVLRIGSRVKLSDAWSGDAASR
jgi:ABC-2 type transport system permease protein